MCLRHCLIRTAGGGVCYVVNIIIQQAGKEVRVCEVTRVVGQLSIVCSRSQVVMPSSLDSTVQSLDTITVICLALLSKHA